MTKLPVPRWLQQRHLLWQKRCELDSWTITVEMYAELPGGDASGNIVAETKWARGYHNAKIKWSRKMYDELSERQLDRFICHELFHLMSAPSHDIWSRRSRRFYEEQERLAERFASVMMKAYRRKPE